MLRPRLEATERMSGGGVIFDLAVHLVVGLDLDGTDECDRMRGSGGCSRGHGRNVGGFEDEDSGGAGVSAGGGHVDDDRNRRGGDLLDDALGGTDEAAW